VTQLPELPEEVKSWIGQSRVEDEAEFEIEQGYIFTYCAATQNGNPLFWDKQVAQSITCGPIAPPTMMPTWLRPHHWAPGRTRTRLPLATHFRLKELLGLPEAIIAGSSSTFGEPVRPGDRLRSREVLRSMSEPRTTKLGTGRRWVVEVEYFNQRDEWVGTESYDCFAYRRD
jgi:acyl dehydratase